MSVENRMHRSDENTSSHGPAVMLRWVELWFQSDRVVWVDSFASVHGAEALHKNVMRFIRVFKTSTEAYLMAFLSHLESPQK